ncbi:hypothetical protein [Piscirickettsia salmonis]|uniref:hypothetical protein n=1 Tax=Piscirickettsia salmonis TaxID=1238 RepID=UPI0007C8CB78|nr:hypothetical protein A0O36_02556 [Piscirickettsiaceae bacterium NZ-RLO1]
MPRARASLLSLLGQRRPRTTHQAGSSTANKFYSLLKENSEEIFRENDFYLSISQSKPFSSETNNAQYISIDLLNEILGVSDFHLTVSSFFKKRSDQDATQLKPLEGHIHCSLKYRDQDGDIHDIKLYCCFQPGSAPTIGLVANKSGKPLDPEIKRQIKAQAIVAMMPLIIKVDQFLQDFEHRKADLENSITRTNTQLSTATELSEKLRLAKKARDLYQQWFQLIDGEDYKYVKNLRNNALPRTGEDGFTVQSASGRLTKDMLDEILRATFKQGLNSLHGIINQLEAEQAQLSGGHKVATSVAPRPHKKHGKRGGGHKKSRGKGKEKVAKKPASRPEETLESYLEKAGNWVAAYLQLQGALSRGDFPRFNQLLQGRMFANRCILFYLDSEALGVLCQPENIAVFKNILISQKDALVLDKSHNKAALADLIKKLIQMGNLEGLLSLHKLRVNLDRTLRDATGKGLMHHLIDVAHKENKDKFYAWFFVNLHENGVRHLDNQQVVKAGFGDLMLWLEPLKRAACMGLPSLTRAFMKAGVKDSLKSVRYVLKKDDGEDEKGRCEVTACDFIVEDMVCGERLEDEELEAERLMEQSELLLAVCNSQEVKVVTHLLSVGGDLFLNHIIGQDQEENQLEKTMMLLDVLSKIFMIHVYKTANLHKKKHQVQDNALTGAAHSAVIAIPKKIKGSRGKARRSRGFADYIKVEELVAWVAVLKFSIYDAMRQYSRPAQRVGLTAQVLEDIDKFMMTGVIGQRTEVTIFNPAHIVEVIVGKLFTLFPAESIDRKQLSEFIKEHVITAFNGEEFQVFENMERHILEGFDLMLVEQPVSNTALAKVAVQSQPTADEVKVDDASNDSRMLFLEQQQAALEVSEPSSMQEYECG